MSVDLWSFSVAFYQRPGIETALLRLQDEASADVPCLLLCLWLADRRIALSVSDCQSCLALAEVWSAEAIAPVRQARRWLKNQDRQDIYQGLKDVELTLEKALLEKLESQCQRLKPSAETPVVCAQKNTRLYLQQAGIALDQSSQECLTELIDNLA